MRLTIKYLGCFLLLLFCNRKDVLSQAVSPLQFDNLNTEKGLSQNSVYDIVQDDMGFMWFATQDGLNRFDGKVFEVFSPKTGKSKALSSGFIFSLCFDSTQNNLWIASAEGIVIYNTTLDSFFSITKLIPEANKWHLDSRSIRKIYYTGANTFWAITQSDGLLKINTKTRTIENFFFNNEDKFSVSCIYLVNNKILAATAHYIYQYDKASNSFVEIEIPGHPLFENIKSLFVYNGCLWVATEHEGCYYISNPFSKYSKVTKYDLNADGTGCFTKDFKNNLWIGTRGSGIVTCNSDFKTNGYGNRSNTSRGLLSDFVLCLFTDKQGIVWAGLSGGGVSKYDNLTQQFTLLQHSSNDKNSLPDNMIFSGLAFNGNIKYFATLTGGLVQYNSATRKFTSYSTSSNNTFLDNSVYNIDKDNKGNLWLASYGGLMEFNTVTKKITPFSKQDSNALKGLLYVRKLNSADSLLVSGDNGTAFFSLKERKWKSIVQEGGVSLSKDIIVRHSFEEGTGQLWLATLGYGLVKYNFNTGKSIILQNVKALSRNIRYILGDREYLYLASDDGLIVYNKTTGNIDRHITFELYGSNVCYAIQKKENYLWVSSNKGLFKINLANYSIKNYNNSSGIPFLEFNTACTWRNEENNTISFGGVGGAVTFNPDNITENVYSPVPIITSYTIDNLSRNNKYNLQPGQHIALKYNQNFVSFYFIATNFSSPEKTVYFYQLEGIDKDWVSVKNLNFTSYTKLAPGNYTFKVKSMNADMNFSQQFAFITITIKPPFWYTWWFFLLTAIVIFFVIYFLYKRRVKKIRVDAALAQRISELEKDKQLVAIDAMLKGQEEERSRIAKDLHDGLGGMLSGAKLSFINMKDKINLSVENELLFDKSVRMIDDTITDLRKVAHNLMPEALVKFGLVDALQDFCDSIQASSKIKIIFQHFGENRELINTATVFSYRIIQELVSNAVRHANATEIIVQLSVGNNKIGIVVEDNGKGYDQNLRAQTKGAGISNIEYRVQYFNGTIDIVTSAGNGTSVNIELIA